MRSLLRSFVAVCAALAIAPANAATPVSFTPVLPSLNPSGVLYYKDSLVVTSVWDTTPAAGKAQLRIVDPTGKQSLVSSGTCPGTPPVCTTTFSMTATPNAAINADLNFTYSTSLLPKTWCFLANGVCVDPSLATASTSFSLVYSVSLQSVTMFSNNALPGVAVTGNSVSVRYTFNTPMATAGLNCTINGFVAFKVVSRYTVTCTRTVSNSDLNGQPSKVLTFWGSTAQFMSTGTVPCTLGLCADTPLITATSDNSAVTQYAPMQTTSVTMISNNADTAKAEVGDTITVTFAFNQFTSSSVLPDCKINGFQATVTSDSKSYICSRQITAADLNGQQTASATFAMVSSSIQSAAGLGCTAGLCTSQSITTLSAGSRVTMYAPNPLSLTAVSISSNSVDHAKAQVGDTITLTLSFNQAVASASGCSIMGAAAPAVISGSTVACSHTVTSSDVSGLATFAVVSNSFTVANGQACTAGLCTSPTVSATTDGSAVVVSVCSSGANVGNYVLSNVSTGKQACLSQCS